MSVRISDLSFGPSQPVSLQDRVCAVRNTLSLQPLVTHATGAYPVRKLDTFPLDWSKTSVVGSKGLTHAHTLVPKPVLGPFKE